MSTIYSLTTESHYDATTKTTGTGQAQSWDAASDMGGVLGDPKYVIANGFTNPVYSTGNYSAVGSSVQNVNVRWYIDPSDLTMGNNEATTFIRCLKPSPFQYLFYGALSMFSGVYNFTFYDNNDSGLFGSTNYPIIVYPTYFEANFQKSSTDSTGDGVVTLRQNNVVVYQRATATIYTVIEGLNQIIVGGIAGIDAGTYGTLRVGKLLITNDANPIGPFLSYRHRPRPAAIMKKRQRIKGHRCG